MPIGHGGRPKNPLKSASSDKIVGRRMARQRCRLMPDNRFETTMPVDQPSAEILQRYRDGDERAADELFSRYVGRLTLLARSRLSPTLASRTDPEDIVLSAYRSFFIAARAGRFTLSRSGDLWRLLVAITLHKVYRQARQHRSERQSLAALGEALAANGHPFSREPSPDEALALTDELESVLSQLDPFARRVLELRLQDRPLSEIAEDVGRSERTVRRTLSEIRSRLSERFEQTSDD
jgi:RNA polymerase sigma factor (sigma-70 family)